EQNDESAVLVDIDDGVATIRFNRPKALNALNVDMAKRFRDIVAEIVARDDVRIIVLCGNGRAFVAGGDLAYFRSAGDSAPQAARELIAPMHQAIEQLINARQPVVASVHGSVAGAGVSLAVAADLVIAADNTV